MDSLDAAIRAAQNEDLVLIPVEPNSRTLRGELLMRIFLTGGTGMIGHRLVSRLKDRSDDVVIVSRSADETRRKPEFRGVQVVPGDPTKPGPWQDEVNGTDAVVNLAGHNVFADRWSGEVRAKIRDSRVYGTENLVEAVRKAPIKPTVFVQGSAIGYYGHPEGDAELTEAGPSGADFLAVVCRELEQAAAPIMAMGLRLATIRTGVVLGRGQGALGAMVPVFKWGGASPVGSGKSWFLPGRGNHWLSWIHLDDIVGLFLVAIDNPDAAGPINGTAPRPARNVDFSRALAKALHRPFLPVGPPDVLLSILLGGVSEAVTKGQRVIPARASELGYRFEHPDLLEAIRSALNAPDPTAGRAAPEPTVATG